MPETFRTSILAGNRKKKKVETRAQKSCWSGGWAIMPNRDGDGSCSCICGQCSDRYSRQLLTACHIFAPFPLICRTHLVAAAGGTTRRAADAGSPRFSTRGRNWCGKFASSMLQAASFDLCSTSPSREHLCFLRAVFAAGLVFRFAFWFAASAIF